VYTPSYSWGCPACVGGQDSNGGEYDNVKQDNDPIPG
jgi:hypothetical protein